MTIKQANLVLFFNGMIEINKERNLSRKLFHAAYQTLGIPKPKSVDLNA